MILLFAAAALAPGAPTAIDAERAFAGDAQRIGQWAAFRKYADHDAVMFTPQAVWARDFLAGRKELPRSVSWAPSASIMSCDRSVAVNAGPYATPAGEHGRFTTVWLKGKNGWHWIYDGGEGTAKAVPASPVPIVSRAACTGRPTGAPIASPPTLSPPSTKPNDDGRGESADKTLGWDWKVEKNGTRLFRVYEWNGHRYAQRVYQRITP
ncbi:MAG: hypothetical protein NVS3B5_06820 [Sphingomicrobium sp.]